MITLRGCFSLIVLLLALPAVARAEKHIYAADHNTGKVVKFKEDGTPLWDFPNRSAHDVQVLANGNILINPRSVQEVSPQKEIVWEVGPPIVLHAEACQRLPNGNTMVADNAAHTVMDITPDKKVVWKYDVPGGANMRMVRRLPNGNTLICASSSHVVLEVNPQKEIVWKYELPFPYLAERLDNGDTLISSGDGAGQRGYYLIQVDKDGKTVWQYGGENAPQEEQLNWPSGFSRQADGTIYVSECLSALIRVISPDRKTFRIIKSPVMEHAATIVVVDEEAADSNGSP
jgi:streptogramin lyase